MKKNTIILTLCVILTFVCVLASCNIDIGDNPVVTTNPELSISNKVESLELGLTYALVFKSKDITSPVVVTSSSESVNVEGNVLFANKVGSATITATSGDVSDSFEVNVVNTIMPIVCLDATPEKLYVNDDFQLVPYVRYSVDANATNLDKIYQAQFTYSSSNSQVLSVSNDGVLTAVALGNATITVDATYSLKQCKMTFDVQVVSGDAVILDKGQVNLTTKHGHNSAKVTPYVWQNNQLVENAQVVWTVESGADVISLDDGLITALSFGQATIKVTYNEWYAFCMVYVSRGDVIYTDVNVVVDKRPSQSLDFANAIEGVLASDVKTVTKEDGTNLLDGDGKLNGALLTANVDEQITLLVGTNTDVYQVKATVWSLLINSVEDLKLANACATVEGTAVSGYFKLMQNLDFNGEVWTREWQLGNFEGNCWLGTGFVGYFDGNGKTISNLKTPSNQDLGGLFYKINRGAIVKDLTMDNVTVQNHSGGALVGITFGGTFTNVTISFKTTVRGWAGYGISAFGITYLENDLKDFNLSNVIIATSDAETINREGVVALIVTHDSVTNISPFVPNVNVDNLIVVGFEKVMQYGDCQYIVKKQNDTIDLTSFATIGENGVSWYQTMGDLQ